jgi:arginyl-tRNA synthetase
VDLAPIGRDPGILALALDIHGYLLLCTRKAGEEAEASEFTTHLYRLARRVSSAQSGMRVKGQLAAVALPRLLWIRAARRVLEDGLETLGLTPMERM